MMNKNKRILIVDDEEFNRKLLTRDLEFHGYETVCAEDGEIALEILLNDNNYDVILLDRMMPKFNGMELFAQITQNHKLRDIPVIMQTAAASAKEIQEGIEAGVYYYLTKPYESTVMLALVKSAIGDTIKTKHIIESANAVYHTYKLISEGTFHFRTLKDVSSLSLLISKFCDEPESAILGISELMMNAIEHGNLGIGFEEKKQMMLENCYYEELENRINHDDYVNKQATLFFTRKEDCISIVIEDMGNGFNPEPFLSLDVQRAVAPNGRGILFAKSKSFNSLQYNDKGNKVCCEIKSR